MNDNDKKIFEFIKEKAKQDKELWHESQKIQNIGLLPEVEEAVIERMFLVHFTERYLEQEKELERLRDRVSFLECLEAAGVDNWEGWDEAWAMMRGESDD
jgi:hypothetical protein